MSRILLLFFLFFLLVHNSTQEDQNDCEAGQYFNQTYNICKSCGKSEEDLYYSSEDGAVECTQCSEDGRSHCICDTTSPLKYLPKLKNGNLEKKCLVADDQLNCSRECYGECRHALSGRAEGAISKQVNIIDCSCENNRKTKESCLERKNFTDKCFQNECDADGTRYYDNDTMLTTLKPTQTLNTTLNSCYTQYSVNKSCSKSECADALSPYLADLGTCNCYHTYDNDGNPTDDTKDCQDRRDFYKQVDRLCTLEPAIDIDTVRAIVIIAVLLLTVFILFLGRYCAVKYGRILKKSGDIRRLIRFVDWEKVKPLGAAGAVLDSKLEHGRTRNADMLHNKEILLKVRFSVLGGCFGEKLIRPQHVVLKIFSESQSEQQGVELGIINSISDKRMAKECNIISVYGPAIDADNSDLVEFLDTLIDKSKTCAALQEVIERNYLGRTGDAQDNMESPRCKYIIMNHCNELSLTKFIKTRSNRLTLNLVKHLCKDLAKALRFIHEINKPTIVHCDIKPDNIFVKSRNKKTSFILGDFGFAEKYENQVFTLKGSTPSFVPPEWYLGYLDHNDDNNGLGEDQRTMLRKRAVSPCKIDIYSYGLIVWLALHKKSEPWTAEYSDDWCLQSQNNHKITKEIFLKKLFNDPKTFKTRPICKKDASNQNQDFRLLLRLAEDCWQSDCDLRPSASEILTRDVFKSRNLRRLVYQDFVQHHHVIAEVQPPVVV